MGSGSSGPNGRRFRQVSVARYQLARKLLLCVRRCSSKLTSRISISKQTMRTQRAENSRFTETLRFATVIASTRGRDALEGVRYPSEPWAGHRSGGSGACRKPRTLRTAMDTSGCQLLKTFSIVSSRKGAFLATAQSRIMHRLYLSERWNQSMSHRAQRALGSAREGLSPRYN